MNPQCDGGDRSVVIAKKFPRVRSEIQFPSQTLKYLFPFPLLIAKEPKKKTDSGKQTKTKGRKSSRHGLVDNGVEVLLQVLEGFE
jgi:hypothetical protein